MKLLHHSIIRPMVPLTVAIALMATLACGATAEPNALEPTEPPASASAMSHGTNEHGKDGQPGQGMPNQASADAVVINLPITNRDTSLTRDDLRVSQGENVSINFTADEPGEIHLHGYDLTAAVSPGGAGELNFVAATAGAFAINFHVFASDSTKSDQVNTDHHHASGTPSEVVSELPVSLSVTAEADADGGIEVHIATEGFRFAPEMVDQAHAPGSGHAHIYLDGVKLGRVFESRYHVADVAPGEREIRVSLNTNDHSELVFNGEKVESTVTVAVPDVGQAGETGQPEQSGDGHGHSHGTTGGPEVIAEVHLGNLEVYP
ncbi:MAG: hypothetical protein OXL37_02070 [Chloroflexota bacterium]|nr:hypothetical protein [Chloroflexota bacterium]MDE2961487.1 hypothetical protein [Chloroflexota bacterium]